MHTESLTGHPIPHNNSIRGKRAFHEGAKSETDLNPI